QALVWPGVTERAAAGKWFPALDVESHLVSCHDHHLRMRHRTAMSTAPTSPLAALPYLILRRMSSPGGGSAVPASTRASQHRQLGVVLAHASHFLSAHPHDAMDGPDTLGRHHNLRALPLNHP